jgi:hypothetical protein
VNHPSALVHVSGPDTSKREQVVGMLRKTLQDRDYLLIEISEQQAKEALAATDEDVLARAIAWASHLLTKSGMLILVSVSPSFARHLMLLPGYAPDLELAIEQEFMTLATHRLYMTAEVTNLPQEIAQAVLTLEEMVIMASQKLLPSQLPRDDEVYSAEEEALLQEHLRSLGYL